MKSQPNISILAGLLFLLDIDYPHEKSIEGLICSADVTDQKELSGIFDLIIRPEYESYLEDDRQWYIDTITYYLGKGDSFESVFDKRSFLFFEEVADGRLFMRVLLECLMRYQSEALQKQ